MPKLRLINPRNPLNGLVQGDVARRLTFGRKAIFMPLGLMVAAGTVPRSWQVEIVDECVQGVLVAKDVDLVGITAMTCQAPRAYEIADAYRGLGVPVILGGIHPSCLPEEALPHATAVAVGEAEGTLPRMLGDFAAGRLSGLYRAEAGTEIAVPRRDLLNPRDYFVNNAVQISRGCPMRCKFCTTAAMYGGRYSVRPIEAISGLCRRQCGRGLPVGEGVPEGTREARRPVDRPGDAQYRPRRRNARAPEGQRLRGPHPRPRIAQSREPPRGP
jgi:radical SAM superfamily enzyme YgiQ (UPF0313 family)